MQVKIRYLTVGTWKENAYLVEYNNESVLIDPGDSFEELDKYFKEVNSKYIAILNTHGHFDHIGAVDAFKVKYDLPFYMHSKDKNILYQSNLLRKFAGETGHIKIPSIDFFLDAQKIFKLNGKQILIHHTPGHSNGSVCFEIDNMLLSGDILFKDSIGRTDLPGGNKSLLDQSLLFILDKFEGYQIYPGHGIPFVLSQDIICNLKALI